jgi:multidrug efflux pump subunit AcrA (membrane-fusion protein)
MDQSQVTISQVAVNNAQHALDQATITSPVDGVVSEVNVITGQTVGGSNAQASSSATSTATHALVVLTPGAYQVTGSVGDAQINQIAVGQRALVTPAGATEAIDGSVTNVAPTATVTSGVATFPVTVTLSGDNPSLHSGVTASVRVVVNQVVDVLTVPTSAVRTAGGTSTVQVLVNGQPQSRPVTIGAVDSQRTQILSGLNQGDTVVIAAITRSVPTNQGGAGGLFGGGGGARFGGGGGGGARGAGGGAVRGG